VQQSDRGRAIWHWGDNGDFRCFVIFYPDQGDGLVYFTNSNNGLAIAESLVGAAFEDTQWSLRYLDYQTWDSPRRAARIGLPLAFLESDDAGWALLEEVARDFPANVADNEARRVGRFLVDEGRSGVGLRVLAWASETLQPVGPIDFSFLVGEWDGELEYLDYQDNETLVRLPTTLRAELGDELDSYRMMYAYEEPGGGVVTSDDELVQADGGVFMGDRWTVEEYTADPAAGSHRVVLLQEGEDDGRPAWIRLTLSATEDELTMTKAVIYDGATESVQRNEYRLRKGPA
jgi:hypothetical protein